MEPVTDHLRRLVAAEPSLKRVSVETGIAYATIHKLARGGNVDGVTVDRLAAHYRLGLTANRRG